MAVTIDITELDVLEAVRNFLLAVLPEGTEVFQGQDNLVPEPKGQDFVVMTTMHQTNLSFPVAQYATNADTNPSTMTEGLDVEFGTQLDVHGPMSAASTAIISGLWKSAWTAAFLRGTIIAPLWASDPMQSSFDNGEEQYETRWIVTIYLQVKPVLTMPQDYANTLAVTIIEADQ